MRTFLVSLLVASSLAAAVDNVRRVVHEKRDLSRSMDWTPLTRASPSSRVPLRVALKQSNLHRIDEVLRSVSHPDSPMYGHHLGRGEIRELFAPSNETVGMVLEWLSKEGIDEGRLKLSPGKGWITVVDATVQEAENLLQTEYHEYMHSTGRISTGCHAYSLPEHIQPHIDFVHPTIQLKMPKDSLTVQKKKRALNKRQMPNINLDSTATCDELITPLCLKTLYDINYTPVMTNVNTFGIVELGTNAFKQSDLDLFADKFNIEGLAGRTPIFVSIDGGDINNRTDDTESDLDIEYAMALTHPQPIQVLQTGSAQIDGFDEYLDAIDPAFCSFDLADTDDLDTDVMQCGVAKPPNVLSLSWGADESSFTGPYMERQCAEYAKLGMMGVSVLYASQDRGVRSDSNCLDRTGNPDPDGHIFNAGFPASCPYVTAVGGTMVISNATVEDPEHAWNTQGDEILSTGGAFSNQFAAPDYQAAQVKAYLDYHNPGKWVQFNTSGSRGYPDLSLNAAFYTVFQDGVLTSVVGTSAATPVFASMLVLINDARLAAGKKPVGFVNPTLYSSGFNSAFKDITAGESQGCDVNITTGGFKAVPGWDPASGLGTPNFSKLMDLWMALP